MTSRWGSVAVRSINCACPHLSVNEKLGLGDEETTQSTFYEDLLVFLSEHVQRVIGKGTCYLLGELCLGIPWTSNKLKPRLYP
jgi:hypothetical protein